MNSTEQASKLQLLSSNLGALISQNANIVFRTTARNIGEKASQITPERPVLHGFNGKFSAVRMSVLTSLGACKVGHASQQRSQYGLR